MPRNVLEQGGGGRNRRVDENYDIPVQQTKQITPEPTPQPTKSKEELASEAATAAQQKAIEEAKNLYMQGTKEAQGQLIDYKNIGGSGFKQWAQGVQSGKFTPEVQPFQFNQYQDPSYQWRLQQGEQALQTSAAARGGGLSGAALKELAGYGQQMASQEYQNAFNRYQTEQEAKRLSGQQAFQQGQSLANIGLGTAQQFGSLAQQQGAYLGELALQGGNVAASGIMAPIDMAFQQQQLEIAKQQAANQKKSGWLNFLGTLGGTALGSFLGPIGAAAGGAFANLITGDKK